MQAKNMVLNGFGLTARLVGAVVLMVVAFIVGGMLSGIDSAPLAAEDAQLAGSMMLLVSGVNALVLSYLALRSRWHGWKLAGALFILQYGIETFMSQIETVVFNQALQLTTEQVISVFITGLVRALIFAPLAVVVLGKTRPDADASENTRLVFTARQWALRLTILAALYVVVYFVFGYFVAWQSADLRQFYSGSTDIMPFFSHMAQSLSADPMLALIQFGRGYLWVLIVLPLVRMFKGGMLETCFALALVLAVLLSDFVLFPNPYMPEVVRMAHFTELWSSMAVFGVLVGLVLARK